MANFVICEREDLEAIADAIRDKTGSTDALSLGDMPIVIAEIGENSGEIIAKEVNFVDYDGTLLYSYTLEEVQALSELPPLPSHAGLICQEWNYDLVTIKSHNRPLTIGATYITDDGKTRIYIHLEEGRTSPMLGCCPNGTVTVDWGDGSATETLTGTSITTLKWTANHNYARAGDYVITLAVDGTMGFKGTSTYNEYSSILRYSNSVDKRNLGYINSVYKIEIGDKVTSIDDYSFYYCYSLSSITIPKNITSIDVHAFDQCYSLSSIILPNSLTSIPMYAFYMCYALSTLVIPNSVIDIDNAAFDSCKSLSTLVIPNSVTSINPGAFYSCSSLTDITIPTQITQIQQRIFSSCCALSKIIILGNIASIDNTSFYDCRCAIIYDFTNCTQVPTFPGGNVFYNIPPDCKIYVPAALYEEWIAATNWATYASYIIAV
jgi:hypothetical protein